MKLIRISNYEVIMLIYACDCSVGTLVILGNRYLMITKDDNPTGLTKPLSEVVPSVDIHTQTLVNIPATVQVAIVYTKTKIVPIFP